MSSLTNFFTSLANKIRSKTGSEATMTPYDMIDAIDDVYDEGVAHGETPTQTKSVTATTTAQTVTPDSGYALSSVTVNPQAHSGTYTATSKAAALDMGAQHNNRYVDTSGVPNTNSGTYTYASGSTGATVDLGKTNTYRYVNAANVYAKGKADGDVKHTISVTTRYSSNDQIFYGINVDGVQKGSVWYPFSSLTYTETTVKTITGV